MTFKNHTSPDPLFRRLSAIHARLAQISDIEANAALHRGFGAKGEFEAERDRLTAETDRLLAEGENTNVSH